MVWLRQGLNSRVLAPLAVFVMGLALAVAAGLWMQRTVLSTAGGDFENAAERVAREIERRFRTPVYGLNGARGTYAATANVDRAAFSAYVESRDLAREFPGVRGFGFIQRVSRDDLPAFVEAMRAEGETGYQVNRLSEGEPDYSYPIRYLEPRASNQGALGLDIGSEQRRREAALRAIDSGEPTITAPVQLVQDDRRTPGVLLFVPVYRPGAPLRHGARTQRAAASDCCSRPS